jgi:hypothetical protein
MPMDFLSDAPWEDLICSPRSQNGGASQWNCARNSVGLRGSFYLGRGLHIDARHDTEIKPRIAKARITRVICTEGRITKVVVWW